MTRPPGRPPLDVTHARQALQRLLREGPLLVHPDAIASVATMPDAEVLALKDEIIDFLRGIAALNAAKPLLSRLPAPKVPRKRDT